MARGRRGNQPAEEGMEEDIRANAGNGEREPTMLEMMRGLMEEQRQSEIRREEARRVREEARLEQQAEK